MQATVKRFREAAEYYFQEGCFITELSNSRDDPEMSIARARLGPGNITRWHRLSDCSERYVILEGAGRVEVGHLASPVNAGDVVIIPPGVRQRISNTGAGDLVFLALCTPPFHPDSYQDLEG